MCILSYLPPLCPVDLTGLRNGGLNNPDGHGWAIVTNDGKQILVGKSLDLDKALDDFAEARAEHINGPALFHSRWMTHGSVSVPNVHPFYVNGSEQMVVAHNGIITRKEAVPEHLDDRSDSRKFADEVLMTQFKRLDRQSCLNALATWVGRSNKLVILSVNPKLISSSYLINMPNTWKDSETGIWHSNGDYRWVQARSYSRYSGVYSSGYEYWPTRLGKQHKPAKTLGKIPVVTVELPEPEEPEAVCEWCQNGYFNKEGFCEFCHTCIDCDQHESQCQCFSPSARDLRAVEEWERGNDLGSGHMHVYNDDVWDEHNAQVIDLDEERWRREVDEIQLAAE